ncbi:hypothetical protein F4804DRAFT_319228 [Jackrogersella minutella]|nr:hypothetical protein F4804DRAFT_319228 [Jackrogersella minutella]
MHESDSVPYSADTLDTTSHPYFTTSKMERLYNYPTPEVAAAMEASAAYQVKIMSSIIGFMGLCWIIIGAFFLYHFYRPLKDADREIDIELQVAHGANEKKWWIDDCDEA